MSDTTTLRLDRDLPEDGIDLGRCAEIGRLLAAEREARALSVEEVAYRLLLSKRQVQALEEPEPRVFHAPIYFVKALRKYCGHFHLADELLEGVAAAPDEEEAEEPGPYGRRGTALAVMLALLLAAAAGAWYVKDMAAPPQVDAGSDVPRATPTAPPPPAPLALAPPAEDQDEEPEPEQEPEPPAPEPQVPVRPSAPGPEAGTAGSVEVARSTWVFVRYPDNSTIERGVAAGERITFRTLPVYVAVGTATGVTLVLGEQPVDVSPFIRNGQVRISRDQILALTSQR